jgi:fumarate reductase subunit D
MTPQDQQQKIQSVGGGAETVREQDKIMLVLAYLGILALIPLLTVKDSEYVKWHAKQGTVLFVAMFVLTLVFGIFPILECPLFVLWGVLTIMGIVKAVGGVRWRMPVLADLSEKF